MKYQKLIVWVVFIIITVSCNSKNSDSGSAANLPPSPDISDLSTCTEYLDAFSQELKHISYCSNESQCGQVLTGTSCGCTRNKVARTDADSSKFRDIIALANAKQCDLPLISTCDCPPANGYACVENQCTWNYQ